MLVTQCKVLTNQVMTNSQEEGIMTIITRLRRAVFFSAGIASLFLTGITTVHAQGSLVLYCTVQEEWCRPMVQAFEKATGIKVAMTRKSSGEFYAQLKAEAANPRGDIWWGGTGDPHLQAAEEGLTQEYRSPKVTELHDWAQRQWEQSKQRTVGVYAGALGYSFNTELLKKKGGAEPRCWADLTNARFKDDVQVADPNASGTSYTMLATLVQIMGEAKAFDYLKALHKNISQYTKSGAAPAAAARSGETLVGITFQHDAVVFAAQGAPSGGIALRGHGLRSGSMSIIMGARNLRMPRSGTTGTVGGGAKLAQRQNPTRCSSNALRHRRGSGFRQHQVHQLRFRWVRFVGRTHRLLQKWDKEVKVALKQ
jgi:iron(III) transport system substrate-binding protein